MILPRSRVADAVSGSRALFGAGRRALRDLPWTSISHSRYLVQRAYNEVFLCVRSRATLPGYLSELSAPVFAVRGGQCRARPRRRVHLFLDVCRAPIASFVIAFARQRREHVGSVVQIAR